MHTERIAVIIQDPGGEMKAASTAIAMTDDDGHTIIEFDGVTLENGESVFFTTTHALCPIERFGCD